MSEIRPHMIGQKFWFEYHCWEDPRSSDAELWYHSHQECEVIGEAESDGDKSLTFVERCEEGCQLLYRVRFDDGFEWTVFEDELLDSPEHYECEDPPKVSDTVAGSC